MSELNEQHWRTTSEIARTVRVEAIEECARLVDNYHGGGMQHVDVIKLALAAAIRELK